MPSRIRTAVAPGIGLLVFLGLPMLGWGIGDVRGFLGQPVRLAYIALVIALHLLVALRFPTVGRYRRPAEHVVERQRIAVVLLQGIGIAVMLAAPYCDRRSFAVINGMALGRYIGLGIFAFGMVLTLWSELFLAEQFSIEIAVREDHRLVTDGLYRRLRHPRYLGIMMFAAGFSLVFRSWLALLLTAAMIPVLLWRIHDEETLLHKEFGTEWEAYSRRSWRLVPFVY